MLEAYAHTRVERPDANLLVRARLVAELGLLGTLMTALARKDAGAVEVLTTQLRRLDDAVHADEDARRLPPHLPLPRRAAPRARPRRRPSSSTRTTRSCRGCRRTRPGRGRSADAEAARSPSRRAEDDRRRPGARTATARDPAHRPVTPDADEPAPERHRARAGGLTRPHDPVAAARVAGPRRRDRGGRRRAGRRRRRRAQRGRAAASTRVISASVGQVGPHRLARGGVEERAAHPLTRSTPRSRAHASR